MIACSRPALAVLSAALFGTLAACASAGRNAPAPSRSPAQEANPGGAVSAVEGEDLRDRAGTIEEMLAARVPGLQVIRSANGDVQLRMRNSSSFTSGTEPLLLVDGVPTSFGTSALRMLQPSDVARIEVLRDAASTAFYGSRGANGVILVTTRVRH